MATTAAPYGARPVDTLGGTNFVSKVRHISIASGYATAIFYGDFVKLVSSGTVEKDTGTATLTPVGIFLGCFYTDATYGPTYSQYWPASTVASDAVAYVIDDPDVIFQIQADGAVAQTNLGNNAGVVQTAGSTSVGTSKNALDQSTLATTGTLPLRVIDFVDGPDSAVGDAYTDVLCIFNDGDHQYRQSTGI